jgi:hypothetical protein
VQFTPGNVATIEPLAAGDQGNVSTSFVYTRPKTLVLGWGAVVPIELIVTSPSGSCPVTRWSMPVVPVAHLRSLRNAVLGLLGVAVIPLGIELVARRIGRRREPDGAPPTTGVGAPRTATGGRR